jgi:hypothetical protein
VRVIISSHLHLLIWRRDHFANHFAPYTNRSKYPPACLSGEICIDRRSRPQDEKRHRIYDCQGCHIDPPHVLAKVEQMLMQLKAVENLKPRMFRAKCKEILMIVNPNSNPRKLVKRYDWLDGTNSGSRLSGQACESLIGNIAQISVWTLISMLPLARLG